MPRWVALLLVPPAVFAALLAWPDLNATWQNRPAHFWIVLGAALLSMAIGVAASEAARRRHDARIFLVSLAFLASSGGLALHALATPGVLQDGKNATFELAVQVGLMLAAAFAAASALDLDADAAARVMARQRLLRGGLLAVLALTAAVVVSDRGPFSRDLGGAPKNSVPWFVALAAIVTVTLAGFAAYRYLLLYRRHPGPAVFGATVSFVLLVEAMPVAALSDGWTASWWEWHVLLLAAAGAVAVAIRREYGRSRSLAGAFEGLYLERTLEHVDRRHARALEQVVAALRDDAPLTPVLDRLRRDGFSSDETALLERSAREVLRIDQLFRPYLAPQLAAGLERAPERAELGGEEREISVLFADLQGFTSFSEDRPPDEVISMLNAYWGGVCPIVQREDGVIERFAGDAIMVVFNADGEQPDHPLRAARAALALHRVADEIAAGNDGWPRFRVGVNTGRAIVGNVGSAEHRSFAAIGDTTNLAARLQGAAEPGQVVIAASTRAHLDGARVEPLPPLELKGKREPVEAFTLVAVD